MLYRGLSVSKLFKTITAGCQTIHGEDCVFPFIYKGQTYNECTKEESINRWCATSVMENGEVITNHWEDCKDSCFDREESVKENEAQGLYSL